MTASIIHVGATSVWRDAARLSNSHTRGGKRMITKLRSVALVLTGSVALAACSGGRGDAEATVRQVLKDPDSAKFGEFYFNRDTGRACLTTNAKNSMGGYTGDSQSRLAYEDGEWRYVADEEESPANCKKYFADVKPEPVAGFSASDLEAATERVTNKADAEIKRLEANGAE